MSRYDDLLEEVEKKRFRKYNDHVLIIDGLNTLIRNFATVRSIAPEGHHTGGLVGFLRSLGYYTRTIDPTRVIVVFDGDGSSASRKNLDPNYKAQRKLSMITNWGVFDNKEEESEALSAQLGRVQDYLECLPVTVMSIDKVEADDVISYIAQGFASKGKRATIVSTDKDFYQIVKEGIDIYSPMVKKMITTENIQESTQVHPSNYLIAKALLGDQSDNLPGVKGLGPKTLMKEFPRLVDRADVPIDYVYDIAAAGLDAKKVKKVHAKIIHSWDDVERSYKIMDLEQTMLSEIEIDTIINRLKEPPGKLHKAAFLYYLEQDSISGITKNTAGWLDNFQSLTRHIK